MNPIGQRLREERLELGLSQEKFGAVGGVAARAQRNYEAGLRLPDAEYLAKIERIGANIHYIVTGHRRSVVVEFDEPAPPPLDFALVKNILELFRGEPRCQSLDVDSLTRVFVVLYRNNLNWKTKIGGDMLSAVLDALVAHK